MVSILIGSTQLWFQSRVARQELSEKVASHVTEMLVDVKHLFGVFARIIRLGVHHLRVATVASYLTLLKRFVSFSAKIRLP